jgi:acetyl esterase/lipase
MLTHHLGPIVVLAICTSAALRPPIPRQPRPVRVSFLLAYLVNELPVPALAWLAVETGPAALRDDLGRPAGWIPLTATIATAVGLVVLAVRARTAGPAMDASLLDAIGVPPRPTRRPSPRALLVPFVSWCPGVRRSANVQYGEAGRKQRLDVYRPRAATSGAPVLIYLHGGGFRMGSKLLGGRPLLYRLAARGWVGVSANYRLQPGVTYAEQLADAKRVVAWVREHAEEYGADPDAIVVSGGSAGAHLAAMVGLTAHDPSRQPGFAEADTSVAAVVGCYGYYGPADGTSADADPREQVHAGAPPFLLVHGGLDTLVPASSARAFAADIRADSRAPVVFAELPGTQHNFDFFHSLRFAAVIDRIEAFAAWAVGRQVRH